MNILITVQSKGKLISAAMPGSSRIGRPHKANMIVNKDHVGTFKAMPGKLACDGFNLKDHGLYERIANDQRI